MENRQGITSATMAKIVAATIISSQFFYIAIGVVLTQLKMLNVMLPENIASILGPVFLLVGIMSAGASILLRNLMSNRAPNGLSLLQFRLRVTIICLAIAEIGGVLGLIYSMLTQQLPVAFALWAISIATGIFLFPTNSWLEGK
jgi:hypothetical protein